MLSSLKTTNPRWLLPIIAGTLLFNVSTVVFSNQTAGRSDTYTKIDIDKYAALQRPDRKGTTKIIRPKPVRFIATIKQHPKKRKVSYLYQALQFFPIDPRPEVNHRMFVTTPGGHIMPVYVEDGIVERVQKELPEEGPSASFYGFHVYNYSKGPAILLTGFDKVGTH